MPNSKPIFALASGALPSPVAIIRLSGDRCHELLEGVVRPIGPGPWKPSMLRVCQFINPKTNAVIDEPLATLFNGPKSYTGEDAAEIHLHGGRFIVRSCIEVLLDLGFCQSEPGEFTQRAFLAGKMDLAAAEGIQESIAAESEQQWLASRQLTSGRLSGEIQSLREQVLKAMAYLEARIDFPDEKETSELSLQPAIEAVAEVGTRLEQLSNSYQSGKIASQGMRVALFGKPNSGKSTLMNAILGEDRAIVTEEAGTTRDYIEESCLLAGRLFRIIDTAGIRDSEDKAEQIGVKRSIEIARKADLVLFLLPMDGTREDLEELRSWSREIGRERSVFLLTKSDLGSEGEDRLFPGLKEDGKGSEFAISARTGVGLDALTHYLGELSERSIAPLRSQETVISSVRHLKAVDTALEQLKAFQRGLEDGLYDEMLAFELKAAVVALEAVIGKIDSDDVLGEIFGSFCIGK